MIHSQLYSRLLGKLAAHWKLLLLALFSMLIVALSMASLPLLIQQILDHTFIQKDQSLIQMTSLAIITTFIVRGFASYLSIYAVGKASSKIGIDLRTDTFNKLLTLPISYYDYLNNNELDTLISRINRITQVTIHHIAILVQDTLTVIGLIICILYLNREFTLLLLLVSPLIVLIIQMTHDHLHKLSQKSQLASQQLVRQLLQSIKHSREIRLGGGQMHESQRLDKIAEPIYQAERQQTRIKATVIPLGQLITALILIAILYFITQQTLNNVLSLDTVGALISAALLLIMPVQRITGTPARLRLDQTNLAAIFSFLDQVTEQESDTQSIQPIKGKLAFETVFFCNDTQHNPILNSITLTIQPGEVIAFTGYTLTEKNILIDLILRLRQPTHGSILLDDCQLSDIQLDNLYANIALVSADNAALDDKIAGNIAYGTLRCANEASITAAAQASHAIEFIREMPDGLQTSIGGQGDAEISRKQWQHIAIARALLKNSPILILDEIPATHELDSDHRLSSALGLLMQNRTVLIFCQKIPHLRKIDRLAVFKHGRVTENANGSQLIQ
ncbi:MAG: ATP-binding cassette domain-containing protein [Nitrosomonas sp.]|jgi:subfamily B ATP-binding cassette protein MsbA|nr:ATP-binding cassette domain-containing protein [Nitrosomonas sp.]